MKKNRRLMEMAGIVHRSSLLLEEEDEGGGDDIFGDIGGGDDEGGDEAADEGGDEGGDEAGEAEEGGDDAKEEPEEEEEPPETIPKKDLAEFGPGQLDQKVDGIMASIFDDSVKAAKVATQHSYGYPGSSAEEEMYNESLQKYNMKYLLEDSEIEPEEGNAAEFDLGYFTSEVARYIKNYDVLMDIEGMLFNKARQVLLNKFGPELEIEFVELLATAHGIDLKGDFKETETSPVPTAVGASAAATGV